MFFKILIKYIPVVILLLFLTACSNNEQKTEDTSNYEKMNWMLGVWEGKQGDAEIYESWRKKNFRIMEGVSFTTENKRRVYHQSMRLEQSNNQIFLILQQSNINDAQKVTLHADEITENKVVLENPENNFPHKVIYNKINESKMSVILAGENNINQTRLTYRKTMDL